MKIMAETIQGLEDVAIDEVKSRLKSRAKKATKSRIQFEIKDKRKLKSLRSVRKCYELVKTFNFSNLKDLQRRLTKIDLNLKGTFMVKCRRTGNHKFKSINIEQYLGKILYKKGFKVNFKEPKNIVYCEIINKKFFLGFLLLENMHKRTYRVKRLNSSIDSCLAYSLIHISKCKKNEIILDPFCKDAVIPIEACLSGIKNVYAIDNNQNNIRNADINVRMAKAKIRLSRDSVDWLDTKFREKSIHYIITFPPFLSKRADKEQVEKSLKELFYQASYILKKDLVLLTPKPDLLRKIALKHNFHIVAKKTAAIGSLAYDILTLRKKG